MVGPSHGKALSGAYRQLTVECLEPRMLLAGNSLQLDGDLDYVEIDHDPALSLLSGGALTIEAWVRPSLISHYRPIASKGSGSSYYFGFYEGKIYFRPGPVPSSRALPGNTTLPANVWTHVAVVWGCNESGDELCVFYVNGETDLFAFSTEGVIPDPNTQPLHIGADWPHLMDDQNVADDRFKVLGVPTDVYVDHTGKALFRTVGFGSGDERVIKETVSALVQRMKQSG